MERRRTCFPIVTFIAMDAHAAAEQRMKITIEALP
jgi:hypothetical protein